MNILSSVRRLGMHNQARKRGLWLERLEDRTLLSDVAQTLATPDYLLHHAAGEVNPLGTIGPMGYTPSQVRHAYGFDQITLSSKVAGDGSGTTIAIVDAFDDPNVANDLHQFDAQFGLPNPTFTKVNQSGGSLLPSPDPNWVNEIALDVEWSHAIAPGAKILLVEASDNTFPNMFAAAVYAARQPGVVAVSMSWASPEVSSETSYDKDLLTPSGHSGVTFLASSGDSGAPPSYPAVSPNVLAIGGTTLFLDGQNNYLTEQAWSDSGGGISTIEAQPAYQQGVVKQSTTFRTNPDVAYDADPGTGFPVYDSYNNGSATPWTEFGGTSDAAPQWAALMAIADQGRILAGKTALDGRSQTLPMLYQLPAADFHDIASGNSLGSPHYSATSGYDLVTGRGTPIANKIVAGLIGTAPSTSVHFSISAPAASTAGSAFAVTVTALDQNSNTVTGYTGTVHFTSSDSLATLPANYTFTAADKGVHTFTNGVTLTKSGTDPVTVTDTTATASTGSATVSVTASSPSHLAFSQQPTNTVAGNAMSPAITVQLLDPYNNLVSANNSATVSVTLGSNPGNGTLSGTVNVTVKSGIATFSNLAINKQGTGYTLQASSSNLGGATSAAFTITPGMASQLAFSQQPSNTTAGTVLTPAVTVQVLDANGNLITTDSKDSVAIGLGANPGSGSLSGTVTVTAQNGVATFSNLAINKPGNNYTLAASCGGLAGTTSAAFNVSPAVSNTTVVSSANPSVAGQLVTFTATVSGAGTPTGMVTFSESSVGYGSAMLTTSGGTTSASLTISSLAAGSHTLTASYSGDSNFQGSVGNWTQVVNKANTNTVIAASMNPAVFGQMLSFSATVGVQSPGTGTPAGTVQFQIDGTNLGSPVPIGGGVATSPAVSNLSVSSHTVQAIYSGDTNSISSSGSLIQTINPGSPSVLLVSGFPSLSTAGTPGNVSVTVQDAYGNTVTGYSGTIHFSSSDNLASLPADYTFTAADNGVHTFTATLVTAGNQLLTATETLAGGITGSQSGITVTPAAPDHFLVVPSVAVSVAGTPFDVTVTVQDAYNNTATGYTGTLSFSSADPYGATLPADYTFRAADNGVHTFSAGATLYTTGTWNVTATDTSLGIFGSANVPVTPAAAVGFAVLSPGTVAAAAPFNLTIAALDPYGNVASNYQGTIRFSTTDPDPGVVLPASYTFTGNDAGMHTFADGALLVTPGVQRIAGVDTNGLTGSDTVTVTAPALPPGGGGGAAVRRKLDWFFEEAPRPAIRWVVVFLPEARCWNLIQRPEVEQAIDALFASRSTGFAAMRTTAPFCAPLLKWPLASV